MNNICPQHTASIKSYHLHHPSSFCSQVVIISMHSPHLFPISLLLSSSSSPPSLPLPVIIPLLLWDCWSPQRDCGMLEEHESVSHYCVNSRPQGDGRTHIFTMTSNGSGDNSSTFLTCFHSLSHHFMGELPGMNTFECVTHLELQSILRCMPTRLPQILKPSI